MHWHTLHPTPTPLRAWVVGSSAALHLGCEEHPVVGGLQQHARARCACAALACRTQDVTLALCIAEILWWHNYGHCITPSTLYNITSDHARMHPLLNGHAAIGAQRHSLRADAELHAVIGALETAGVDTRARARSGMVGGPFARMVPKRHVVVVMSRASCSSCRIALAHLAKCLKLDITAVQGAKDGGVVHVKKY